MNGTIDESIWNILQRKQALFERPLDGLPATVIEGSISEEEWLQILGLGAGVGTWRPTTWGGPVAEGADQLAPEEILALLRTMERAQFERLVGELLHRLGYAYTYRRVPCVDSLGGIDIIAKRLTLQGPQEVAVQCRQDGRALGVRILREMGELIASHPTFAKGIVVTPGTLSPAAERFCRSMPTVDNISGSQLIRYIREFGIL
jgi:hypothetical protein